MTRKWIAALMALLMTMMLPLCALADVQHTLTFAPGELIAQEPGIADLLETVAFTLTQGSESGQLTFSMGEKDIASIGLKADSTGLYAQSSLLGDGVYYVTWEDGMAVMSNLLKASLESAGTLDAATAEALDTAMGQMKDVVVASTQAVAQPMVTTPKQAIAMVETIYPDDPGMKEYVTKIYDRMTVEKGVFTAENRDPATEKYAMTLTEEDMAAVCDTKYMRDAMEKALVMEDPDLQGAELTAAVDKLIDEVREEFANSEIELRVDVYTVDDGLTLTGMEMTMDVTSPAGEEGEQTAVNMTVDFARLTDESGVHYEANVAMGQNGVEISRMLFTLLRGVDEVTAGTFGILADGVEIKVLYHAANELDVRTRKFDLYYREGAAGIIAPAASEKPIFGVVITTSPADSAVLAAIEAADSTTAQDVMRMSEAKWNELAGQVELKAMTAMYAMLGELPSSTMALVQQMMQ